MERGKRTGLSALAVVENADGVGEAENRELAAASSTVARAALELTEVDNLRVLHAD